MTRSALHRFVKMPLGAQLTGSAGFALPRLGVGRPAVRPSQSTTGNRS